MHSELRAVFAFFQHVFPSTPIAIHGSAVRDYAAARDIDVMVLADADYVYMCRQLGVKYSGWNVTRDASGFCTPIPRGVQAPPNAEHLRRTVHPIHVEGVSKPVQLSQSSKHFSFADHPHALLLPSGKVLNPGCYHLK